MQISVSLQLGFALKKIIPCKYLIKIALGILDFVRM